MNLKQIRFFKDGLVSAKNFLNLEEQDKKKLKGFQNS
jgi:hypothetical protein